MKRTLWGSTVAENKNTQTSATFALWGESGGEIEAVFGLNFGLRNAVLSEVVPLAD